MDRGDAIVRHIALGGRLQERQVVRLDEVRRAEDGKQIRAVKVPLRTESREEFGEHQPGHHRHLLHERPPFLELQLLRRVGCDLGERSVVDHGHGDRDLAHDGPGPYALASTSFEGRGEEARRHPPKHGDRRLRVVEEWRDHLLHIVRVDGHRHADLVELTLLLREPERIARLRHRPRAILPKARLLVLGGGVLPVHRPHDARGASSRMLLMQLRSASCHLPRIGRGAEEALKGQPHVKHLHINMLHRAHADEAARDLVNRPKEITESVIRDQVDVALPTPRSEPDFALNKRQGPVRCLCDEPTLQVSKTGQGTEEKARLAYLSRDAHRCLPVLRHQHPADRGIEVPGGDPNRCVRVGRHHRSRDIDGLREPRPHVRLPQRPEFP
ncbi:MAG: hypothetical protein IPL40_14865 [Proteobacteria bacterium]|nr:hypothetical protein [Pseudomonadota bacterium]